MKNKILKLLLICLLFITITSCGKIIEEPKTPDLGDNSNQNNNNNNNNNQNEGKTEFTVSLIVNKKTYLPKENEEINVIWADDYSQYTAVIGSDGYAKIYLDGAFNVYLDSTPENYTYNPNLYNADNTNSTVEIELLRLVKPTVGNGKGLYSGDRKNNPYQINMVGTYQTTVTAKNQKVYYEYHPSESGTYVIESIVNIHEDIVNPKLHFHEGSSAWKNPKPIVYEDGGTYKSGGYTSNFKFVFEAATENLGNPNSTGGAVFTFGILADSQIDTYPVTVDFIIRRVNDFELEHPDVKLMVAEEADLAKIPDDEWSTDKHIYINSDGGTGSYYAGVTNGTGLLKGENFKYNEETKLWHVWDSKTNTFGPKLCAKITLPCAYYDQGLNIIEYNGNSALTVSDGTENYKFFIENSYAAVCNSDGVCYVTMELMIFLQKFSVSQRLFFDGYGFVESTGVYAAEEDQWLFACGYYLEK